MLVLRPGKLIPLKNAQLEISLDHLVRQLAPVLQLHDVVVEPGFFLDELLQGLQGGFFLFFGAQAAAGADVEDVDLCLLAVEWYSSKNEKRC